jgi:hypothetical protein
MTRCDAKYQSITTPEIQHDVANILTEFVWLNNDLAAESFPWREHSDQWGKIVAAIKKLMGAPYHLTSEQIAFYIFKCNPRNINPFEFAKMAVVARKLFRKYDIDELHRVYQDRRRTIEAPGLAQAEYKTSKPKSFLTFLRELERGEA